MSEMLQDFDPKLRSALVCPITREPLVYDQVTGELISHSAKLTYPVRHGMPIMLPAEARVLRQTHEALEF